MIILSKTEQLTQIAVRMPLFDTVRWLDSTNFFKKSMLVHKYASPKNVLYVRSMLFQYKPCLDFFLP